MLLHTAPNNGMHPTADTLLLMFSERCGAAGDAGRYAAHLHLNERAHEISTVHPAAAVSSHLDRPCGPAPLLGAPCHFANAR